MRKWQLRPSQSFRRAELWRRAAVLLLIALLPPAAGAQDIRGLEVCTAEKQIERRTGCLQANAEYLQQALTKLSRETDERLAAAARELAAARAEIGMLRSTVDKLSGELAQIKAKADSGGKK
jgi:F0F1-type ATP synthase membrane subunit b/b'